MSELTIFMSMYIQILMNVRLVLTTVIKSVPTLKAPSPVPVTVDIHSQVMEDHAMVRISYDVACEVCVFLDIAVVLIH